MKREWHLLGLLTVILGFTACQDYYYIENEYHGMWQVTSITNKNTGEVSEPQGSLYYSFQRSMVRLSNKSSIPEVMVNYVSYFDIIAPDSIGMGEFVFSSVKEDEKVPIENLYKFGIYQDYTTFGVERNKDVLKLSSDSSSIVLRKY